MKNYGLQASNQTSNDNYHNFERFHHSTHQFVHIPPKVPPSNAHRRAFSEIPDRSRLFRHPSIRRFSPPPLHRLRGHRSDRPTPEQRRRRLSPLTADVFHLPTCPTSRRVSRPSYLPLSHSTTRDKAGRRQLRTNVANVALWKTGAPESSAITGRLAR